MIIHFRQLSLLRLISEQVCFEILGLFPMKIKQSGGFNAYIIPTLTSVGPEQSRILGMQHLDVSHSTISQWQRYIQYYRIV
jgi:hypothetical protein